MRDRQHIDKHSVADDDDFFPLCGLTARLHPRFHKINLPTLPDTFNSNHLAFVFLMAMAEYKKYVKILKKFLSNSNAKVFYKKMKFSIPASKLLP